MQCFQFTLGPVQGFVSQARRTRDFWGGSFLLSYLTGQAMMALLNANYSNKIVYPVIRDSNNEYKDKLLKAIDTYQKTGKKDFPMTGSIPNRFLAQVVDKSCGQMCVEAVQSAWQALAQEIWDKYVSPIADLGCGTEDIWKRQINGFWEMSWVFGKNSDTLDRRKNWRSHIPPEEPGDKCTLMGNWQELSGYVRIADRSKQDRFWKTLGDRTLGEDIRKDERLCSIALVKRLFPHVLMDNSVRYPSTPYLAAVPWLSSIVNDTAEHDKAINYAAIAHGKTGGHEPCQYFFIPNDLKGALGSFLGLDGNCFFQSTLENDELWPADVKRKGCRPQMVELLKQFKTGPSPFYALLMMDGDRIGTLIAQEDKRVAVSQALSDFSGQVDGTIAEHEGITVYAGGDDVLALLPMDKALDAAAVLRRNYMECFKMGDESLQATISAAIVYAHHHAPLRQIITEAHRVLDKEAKEKTGRDAIAISVWKTGGTAINWSAPWEVKHARGDTVSVIDILKSLITNYQQGQISNSWLYGIRGLSGNSRKNEFEFARDMDLPRLLAAELVRNRETNIEIKQAEKIVQDLLTVCLLQQRNGEGDPICNKEKFSLDGGLLIKFLVTKGVE